MEMKENPRLGVKDKRLLFTGLLAKTERLFFLNKFPVDMVDYALSLEEPVVEDAWRVLREKASKHTLSSSSSIAVTIGNNTFLLSDYDKDNRYPSTNRVVNDRHNVFMRPDGEPDVKGDNRFYGRATEWARRQLLLEGQMLRTMKVIKSIVWNCNTVGQYKRVSPELIGFLPDKYAVALGDMTKKSPYPDMSVTKAEIDAAMSTLAYASLQPVHKDEKVFIDRPTTWGGAPTYRLSTFPRTTEYEIANVRSADI